MRSRVSRGRIEPGPRVARRTRRQSLVTALALTAAVVHGGALAVEPASRMVPLGLRCEHAANPVAIDVARPRLSWRLESPERADVQTAYRILAASAPTLLDDDRADLWDSGTVSSSRTLGVEYQGRTLESSQRVFWKVRAWDKAGRASAWSEAAGWETGLLAPGDWQAQWLDDGRANPRADADFYRDDPAPLFRKEFAVTGSIARARLHICGLGYCEASLNGRRIGDQVLDPGWTRYSERALYSTYDVTDHLRTGDNCLGVSLGNGWFNPLPLRLWGRINLREHLPVGRPRFIARLDLEYTDGSRRAVVSDGSWTVGAGPVRFNSIYLGEVYDARREVAGWDHPGFDDTAWRPPAVPTEPVGPLRAQSQPPIRVTKTIAPVKLTEPQPGVFIFDMGRNFAGWASVRLDAPTGTKVLLRYGELLNADGTLNPLTSVAGQIKGTRTNDEGIAESIGGPGAPPVAWQSDTYIAKGTGAERYTPRFTFHAFRYLEVTGLPRRPALDDVVGLRLNSDVPRAGSFTCSDDRLDRIQDLCDGTFLSNLFSVQSDCPHRERFGYGGDIAVTSDALMMNYDMAGFYAKAIRDWQDSARPDGMLTDTAPFVGIQYCGLGWAQAHPLLLRELHRHYGDDGLLAEQYAVARRWLDAEARRHPRLIVDSGLSDHESLEPTPAPALVTPLFARSADLVAELAAALGHDDEAHTYARLATDIRAAYAAQFLDPVTGRVGPGTQSSQAFALHLGMVPEPSRAAAFRFLLDRLERHDGHLTTGIFGTKFLLDELSRAGRSDVAARLVRQRTFPGWGHMLDNGATTLWEHWQGGTDTFSHNHPMFGSVSAWLYRWLGGIQPAADAVGFDRIVICPQPIAEVAWVRCSHDSVRGRITSSWKRDGARLEMEIEIPANTTALVRVPTTDATLITVNGEAATASPLAKPVRQEVGHGVFEIGSGRYTFASPVPSRPGG